MSKPGSGTVPATCAVTRERALRVLLTATREAADSWKYDRGRLSQTRLAPLVDSPETLCFVCGPPALVEEVPRALMNLGIAEGKIRTEIF